MIVQGMLVGLAFALVGCSGTAGTGGPASASQGQADASSSHDSGAATPGPQDGGAVSVAPDGGNPADGSAGDAASQLSRDAAAALDANDSGGTGATPDAGGGAGLASCGCNGKPGCAVWSDVYISFYGFNDNSCGTEAQHGCNDIAYPAPVSTAGSYGTPYPNAGNITHTQATEGKGTYDDPITAASSADTDPQTVTTANPRHQFESAGGVTLSPGTILYNPMVQKYFIMEDSCIECGDEYACIVSPEDTDDGTVPAACVPETNLHIDFWMGPPTSSDATDLNTCESNSTLGNDWTGGPGQVVVNPPNNLPVNLNPLYVGTGTAGGCWTSTQVTSASCP